MEETFKVGDEVNTPFGIGEIWKITDKSIHVKHWNGKVNCQHDWLYSKYLKVVTHHSQESIECLTPNSK